VYLHMYLHFKSCQWSDRLQVHWKTVG